jgi:hypothetical protein
MSRVLKIIIPLSFLLTSIYFIINYYAVVDKVSSEENTIVELEKSINKLTEDNKVYVREKYTLSELYEFLLETEDAEDKGSALEQSYSDLATDSFGFRKALNDYIYTTDQSQELVAFFQNYQTKYPIQKLEYYYKLADLDPSEAIHHSNHIEYFFNLSMMVRDREKDKDIVNYIFNRQGFKGITINNTIKGVKNKIALLLGQEKYFASFQ